MKKNQTSISKINNLQFQKQELFKQEANKQHGFTEKPSQKLTQIKCSDPFAPQKNINSFAYVYNAGGIPCKIDHGCNKNSIKWNLGVDVNDLKYDPILITCFEGLVEEKHPYNFIAKQVIRDMLENQQASDKTIPILNKLVWPLRTALSSKNEGVYENALDSLNLLSEVVQDYLNPHLKILIVPLMKTQNTKLNKENIFIRLYQIILNLIKNNKLKDKILTIFRKLESNGGPDAQKIIKSLCPTLSGV